MRRRSGRRTGTIGTSRRRRGAAVLEAALVMPILVFMLLGILEVGLAFEARGIVANAARQAARLASTKRFEEDAIQTAVDDYLKNAFRPRATRAQVTFETLTIPPDDLGAELAARNVVMKVSVSINLMDVLPSHYFFSNPAARLSSSAVWCAVPDPD